MFFSVYRDTDSWEIEGPPMRTKYRQRFFFRGGGGHEIREVKPRAKPTSERSEILRLHAKRHGNGVLRTR